MRRPPPQKTLLIVPPSYRVGWIPAASPVDASAPDAAGGDTAAAGDTAERLGRRHHLIDLADGARLVLPLIALPGGEKAVALLMSNQTDFTVERAIVERMVAPVRAAAPDAVVGIPTLGLSYARPIAEAIGLPEFVALGHSRKFWYDDELSEPVTSSTSPDQTKRLYLDPALLERVHGRRVVVVDDVLNTGATVAAAINLLHKAQARVSAIVVVLTEGWDWHRRLAEIDRDMPNRVSALGHIPLFARTDTGWKPLPGTEAGARPA